MSVLRVKNGDQWDIVPAIKGDTGDPAADESITDDMLVPDGIKTEIDWLWGNQLMDIREGELLKIDDAYEGPLVSLDVDGKSTQVVTTGKNLFNKEGPKGYWSDTDGSFVKSTLRVWWSVPVSEGDVIRTSATGVWKSQTYLNGVFVEGNIDTRPSSGYVIPSGVDEIRGSIAHNGWNTGIVTKNNADLTYEPYTGGSASPRPDWPQEIASINECELMVVGNAQNLYQTLEWSDGYFNSAGNVVESNISEYTDDYIPVSVGDVLWYLSSCGKSLKRCIRLNVYNSEKVRVIGQGLDSPGSNYAINTWYVNKIQITDSRAAYIRISFDSYYNNPEYDYKCIFAISPITSPLLPDGYSLRSLPNGTKDELHLSYLRPSTREGWAWYDRELVKRVGVDVITNGGYQGGEFDTTNGFTLYAPWAVFGITDADISASVNNIRCDTLQAVTSNDTTKTNVIWARSTNLVINLAGYTTQSDANAALRALAPSVHYVLATPITTQLDPIELPIMPSKDTTIWSDPSAHLKMTYIQDTNLVIQNLEATVADMATS